MWNNYFSPLTNYSPLFYGLLSQITRYFIFVIFKLLFCRFRIYAYFCSVKSKKDRIMEIKKPTYEEALARFKKSLEIKRAAEKRIEEQWRSEGYTGAIVSL